MAAGKVITKIKQLKKIAAGVYLLSFDSPALAKKARPGQFLHLKIPGTVLRRPFSIHKVAGKTLHILFRVRGKGTALLAKYQPGDELDIIGPLGNGFRTRPRTKNILVAGGIGVAPLLFLAQALKGKNTVLLGAKNKKEVLCASDFKKLGFKIKVATDNGSQGLKGTVADLLKKFLVRKHASDQALNLYACGPEAMFKAVHKIVKDLPRINCQVSFEQFMGCGLGICCGCTIETKQGYKKVCKDGPVFDLAEVF